MRRIFSITQQEFIMKAIKIFSVVVLFTAALIPSLHAKPEKQNKILKSWEKVPANADKGLPSAALKIFIAAVAKQDLKVAESLCTKKFKAEFKKQMAEMSKLSPQEIAQYMAYWRDIKVIKEYWPNPRKINHALIECFVKIRKRSAKIYFAMEKINGKWYVNELVI